MNKKEYLIEITSSLKASLRLMAVSSWKAAGELNVKVEELNQLLSHHGYTEEEKKPILDIASAMVQYRKALDNIIFDLS